jgi:hypothetical protein
MPRASSPIVSLASAIPYFPEPSRFLLSPELLTR